MPRWKREVAVTIVRELGGEDAVWLDWDPNLAPRAALASRAVLNAVGWQLAPDERVRVLAELAARVADGTVVVMVDHNRPRRLAQAIRALVGSPRVPGGSWSARWRRLAEPTARTMQAVGFRVDRLRLAAGERVQVVIATRTRAEAGDRQGSTTVDGTQRSRGPKNGN